MSINHFGQKIKPFLNIIIVLEIILILLGFVYILKNNMEKSQLNISTIEQLTKDQKSDIVMGSKNGKTYYFPWCGGLSRIKKENIVEFGSVAVALQAGYRPAKNCKGL